MYVDIPSWYLQCEKDRAFLLVAQQGVVGARIEARVQLRTEAVDASHSSFISKFEKTAEYTVMATSNCVQDARGLGIVPL